MAQLFVSTYHSVPPEERQILCCSIVGVEVEIAIKEMTDKKARGDDVVPVDVLKLLGADGLRIITELINNMYETGECPRISVNLQRFS